MTQRLKVEKPCTAEREDFSGVDGVVGKIVRSVVAGKVAVVGDPTDNRDYRSDPVVKNDRRYIVASKS